MDFNQFDSRAAAETASRLHIVSPVTGEPLYADGDKCEKPCIVLVRGNEARAVQAAHAARRRQKAASKKGRGKDDMEEFYEGMVASAIPLIVGFENIARGKEPATVADAEWFLNLNLPIFRAGADGERIEKSFVEQVIEHAGSRANYLGNGSKR